MKPNSLRFWFVSHFLQFDYHLLNSWFVGLRVFAAELASSMQTTGNRRNLLLTEANPKKIFGTSLRPIWESSGKQATEISNQPSVEYTMFMKLKLNNRTGPLVKP